MLNIFRSVRLPLARGGLFSKGRNKICHHDMEPPLVGLQLRSRQEPVHAPTEILSWGSPVAYFKRMLPSL